METSRRFSSILALSLLAHGAAVCLLPDTPVIPSFGKMTAPTIDVAIVAPAPVNHAAAAVARHASPTSKRTSPVAPTDRTETQPPVRHRSPSRLDAASTPAPEPVVAKTGVPQDRPAPVDAEAQELRISQAVRQHLQAHFEYPWLARKRNWQGDVLLTLHIERDGRLSRVALDTSSGYPALDRSALESAQRIGRIPEAGRWLGDAGYDLILPVRYRLTDG